MKMSNTNGFIQPPKMISMICSSWKEEMKLSLHSSQTYLKLKLGLSLRTLMEKKNWLAEYLKKEIEIATLNLSCWNLSKP